MDFLHSLYDIVSGLGSFLLIPVFFFLMGLVTHAGFQRSGQCALAMLGSTVAIQLLINTLSGRLTTLVSAMVDNYSLSTGAQNLPWQTAAEMPLNSDMLYWVLPGAVLLNLLMLACRVTRVLNMDLWSLWQAAFAGANATKGRPTALIAHTVKGKGISFMEGQAGWHGKAPNAQELAAALAELDRGGN